MFVENNQCLEIWKTEHNQITVHDTNQKGLDSVMRKLLTEIQENVSNIGGQRNTITVQSSCSS